MACNAGLWMDDGGRIELTETGGPNLSGVQRIPARKRTGRKPPKPVTGRGS